MPCFDWSVTTPSISIPDVIRAEKMYCANEISSEEWLRVREWFAPWADMTRAGPTLERWWGVAEAKIRKISKQKRLIPGRLIDKIE